MRRICRVVPLGAAWSYHLATGLHVGLTWK